MVGYGGERRSGKGRQGRPIVGMATAAAAAGDASKAVGSAGGTDRGASASSLGKLGRWLVSGWLVIHLLSIVAEPLRMFSRSEYRPAAPHIWLLRSSLAPYIEFLYLSHGYFFFAPNPGPNHILELRFRPPTERASSDTQPTLSAESLPDQVDGSQGELGYDRWRLPERGKQWPRLLYHRYFMLAEFYQQLYRQAPIELEEEALRVPEVWDQWQEARQLYLDVQASLRRRAMVMRPQQTVEIRRLMHELPSDVLILQEGWKVNDPRLYITLPESVTELDRLDAAPERRLPDGEELPRPLEPRPAAVSEVPAAMPSGAGGQASAGTMRRGAEQ